MKQSIFTAFLIYFLSCMPLMPGKAMADTCNGTNGGAPCMASYFLTGTCDDSGTCQPNGDPDGTCTSDKQYNVELPAQGKGIISTIIKDLKNTLSPIAQQMFQGITTDYGFKYAVSATLTLYLTIYAIMFTFGMVQITLFDFFRRMVKIAIVAMLLNGTAWAYFSSTFITFFNEGTDSIITQVSSFAVNGSNIGGNPFDWMDQALVNAVSIKMMITLLATAVTGPFGAVIVLLLGLSLWGFLKSLLNAMWVYIMALVMRTLLFGLAPLFFSCILFSRTRQLFDGWLNQVVNSCLQPIFLFTFFAFFVQLMKSCIEQLLVVPVCWTSWGEWMRGTPSNGHFWRFAVWSCKLNIYIPFDGVWGFTGPENTGCAFDAVNPIGIMLPLTMWILADLAQRFNHTVVQIAKDIANVSTDFSHAGGTLFGGGAGGGTPGGGGGGKSKPGAAASGRGAAPTKTNRQGQSFEDVKKRFKAAGAASGIRPLPGSGPAADPKPPAPKPPRP